MRTSLASESIVASSRPRNQSTRRRPARTLLLLMRERDDPCGSGRRRAPELCDAFDRRAHFAAGAVDGGVAQPMLENMAMLVRHAPGLADSDSFILGIE